jgi:alpha/beta superfamily hydrolase
VTEVPVSFSAQDGLQLEGLFNEGSEGRGGVILCHPHPLYGGDMHNNVIGGLQSALAGKGFSTFRFNFRGVGGSKGSHADGIGEEEDVRGAVDFITTEQGADIPLYLLGYSFGAAVGTKAVAGDERAKAWVCISPPIAMYDFSHLTEDRRPKLLVAGDGDFVCPVSPLEELFDSLPEPRSLHIVPDADHFWWGMEKRLAESVVDFLQGLERG